MNKIDELIKYLKDNGNDENHSYFVESRYELAYRKEYPRCFITDGYEVIAWNCPVCDTNFLIDDKYDYCPCCGQHYESWEDYDESEILWRGVKK